MSIDTDVLTKLLADATQGPWILDNAEGGYTAGVSASYGRAVVWVTDRGDDGIQHEPDARLIALAPALAAEVIALRAKLAVQS